MAFHIYYASSADVLLDHLVEALARPGDPERSRPVLLPSRPLVERLRARVALRGGVAMGFEPLLPSAFLARVADGLGLEPLDAAWSTEGMLWRVLDFLPELARAHPRVSGACQSPAARLSLAREIADHLDQITHFRPDLIKAWDAGLSLNDYLARHPELKDVFDKGFDVATGVDEAWLRACWDHLRGQLKGNPHTGQRYDEMIALAETRSLEIFEPGLEVLATGPLPFIMLRTLRALGQGVEVNLRTLMPASYYLGDVRSRWRQLLDNEDVDLMVEGHPLIAQMGRQAIEAFRGLEKVSGDGEAFEGLPEPEREGDSLLARLQADARALRQPEPALRPVAETLPQGERPLRSLRVARCYGPRREVEFLRDELLRAFDELPDLKPEEILILAPDLETYAPLAEAIFTRGSLPRLPLALAERSLVHQDDLLKALLAMLELAAGRVGMSDLADFLDLSATREALGRGLSDTLESAFESAGLSFGLDVAHRRALGAGESAQGTWRASLDRLIAGLWVGQDPAAVDKTGSPLLSRVGDLGGGRQDLIQALDWAEALLATLVEWQDPAPPEIWAERLERALETVLRYRAAQADPEASLALIRSLRAGAREHGASALMDAATLALYTQGHADEETRRVVTVGGQIALGGLKPLRALPCRVLCLLGLSDTAFPRRSQAKAWDLLAALPLSGDRDPRKDDRQLFLDCALAPRDRLLITAPARDPRNDSLGALSPCVDELLRVAIETLGPATGDQEAWGKALLSDEPLQPFSPRHFDGAEGRPLSYDSVGLELARRLAGPRQAEPFAAIIGADAETKVMGELLIEDLARFLGDPAKAFLSGLGLAQPPEPKDLGSDDDEPIDSGDGLAAWALEKEALEAAIQQSDPYWVERLAADKLLPQGHLGRLRGDEAAREAQALAQELRRVCGGVLPALEPESAALGKGWVVRGSLRRLSKSLLRWTQREIGFVKGQATLDAREMLRAWLEACLSAVAGQPLETLLLGFEKGAPRARVLRLPALAPKDALAVLRDLAALRVEGRQSPLCFAPKTSLAMASVEDEDKAKEAAFKAWRGNDFGAPGEGDRAAARWVWRDQDPFEDGRYELWRATAHRVWDPVLAWWKKAEVSA